MFVKNQIKNQEVISAFLIKFLFLYILLFRIFSHPGLLFFLVLFYNNIYNVVELGLRMSGVEEVNRQKERIISTMRARGPLLPVQVAKDLGVSLLFAGAFLSELKAEDKLRLSNMRVGSSPLYFLKGQESLLEGFVEYLNGREKEALTLLRGAKVLEDSKQTPVVRVALRAIKDFAVPVKVRVNGESKLFWKHFTLDDSEIGKIVSKGISVRPKEKKEEALPTPLLAQKGKVPEPQKVDGSENLEKKEKTFVEPVKPEKKEEKKVVAPKPAVKKKEESEFGKDVRDYLVGKDIELLEVFSEKKREFEARVRIDTMFGKQEFYLVAKDKRSATENDIVMSWQKAHGLRLQALIMSTGDLNKKAKAHLGSWKNLVKFEKLKF